MISVWALVQAHFREWLMAQKDASTQMNKNWGRKKIKTEHQNCLKNDDIQLGPGSYEIGGGVYLGQLAQ